MRPSRELMRHLGSTAPGSADLRAAHGLLVVLLLAFCLAAPLARWKWPAVPAFVPIYDAVIAALAVATALALHAQFRAVRRRAFAWLAAGYGFVALVAVAHGVSFPGAFGPGTLLGDAQTTAWLWLAWHGGLPLFVLAYALDEGEGERLRSGPIYAATLLAAVGLVALASGGEPWLPRLMDGSRYHSLRTWVVMGSGWALHVVAALVLWHRTRGRTLIDLWLLMALLADAIDLVLSGLLVSSRYQAGFYLGRAYGLAATCFVLARLLIAAGEVRASLEQARVQLQASESLYEDLLQRIPQLVWRTDPRGRAIWASLQWQAFTGCDASQLHGEGWLALVHADDCQATREAWVRAAAGGEYDVEHRLRRADGAWVWHRSRARPRFAPDGALIEWFGTSTDVDELKRLQGQQAMMMGELQHRTRNLLGVVSAITERTAARAADLPGFLARYRERLQALGRVQGMLSGLEPGQRVSFDQLLQAELASLGALDRGPDDPRVDLRGPLAVPLCPSCVQTFALGLHELATNAVKYGALSQPDGRLSVHWDVERDEAGAPWVAVEWRESNVRLVRSGPLRRGFGRDLIERALPMQLHARTRFELRDDGVACSIRVPLREA